MKKQNMITLILLLLLLSSTIQFKQKITFYVEKAACLLEAPVSFVTHVAHVFVKKDTWESGVRTVHFLAR